ncbi:MAG: hypothetical protein GQ564_21200 [Bacteroidales bacterium]|nr:hypothetical protein [Bacteroidales bacterium]
MIKHYYLITIIMIGIMLICNKQSYGQLGIYAAGDGAGFSNSSGDFNTFIGDSAGYTNTTGLYNTFIGYRAGYSLTFPSFTQSDNTIIGAEAMGGNPVSVASTDNVIIGKMAGYNHYGTDAVIIGTQAGFYNENGADVVFIGEEAGFFNTEGDDNVFVGEDAGYNNTTASDNTFVGNQAGRSNIIGTRNAFFGNEAGWDNKADRNTFIGDSAGVDVGVGHHNTFVGQASGSCTEHADYNTFIGSNAGWDNNRTDETNNANYNTYLGYKTGYTNREGQYNVLLGALTDFSSTAMGGNGSTNSYNIGIGFDALINGERVYSCVIGANARVSTDNSFVIGGTTSVTRMSVGIGTDSPDQDASLELAENDKGFLINRLSNSEKTTFASVLAASDEGMMIYDSTSKILNIWDGSQWKSSGIQNLGLLSNILSITDGNTVDLSVYMDNTDAQDLTLTTNTLSLTNDGTTVDLSPYLDDTDTDDQTLSLITNTLSIADGNSVDLSGYLDNTDEQDLAFDGTNLSIVGGNSVDISGLQDGFEANTDEQDLTLTGNTLALTNDGTTVDLSLYLDDTDTDDQTLSLITNTLSIADGNSVDLSGYLDNTDEQDLAFDGTNLSIVGGNSIDISGLQDGFEANTDAQNLTLIGNTLALTNDGTTVDLSTYLDDTDDQTLSLSSTTLSISEGNSVDITSIQDGFEANTDEQTLSLISNTLLISNGNSVDLSSLATSQDNQSLSDVSLTGSTLSISIENGNTLSVDLAPLLAEVFDSITNHQNRISELEMDIAYLKSINTDNKNVFTENSGASIYQNIPNPTNGLTRIQFYIPQQIKNASIMVFDNNGIVYKKIEINKRGFEFIDISTNDLNSGLYYYSLILDGLNAGSKKMSVTK